MSTGRVKSCVSSSGAAWQTDLGHRLRGAFKTWGLNVADEKHAGRPRDSKGKSMGLREKIQFYLMDIGTPLGKFIDIFIVALNVSVCVLYVLQTYPLPSPLAEFLWRLEEAAVVIFILEYIIRIFAAPDRFKQIFGIYSLIDLVAILPTLSEIILPWFGLTLHLEFIHTLRAFRVFRIFRLPEIYGGRRLFFRTNQSACPTNHPVGHDHRHYFFYIVRTVLLCGKSD